MAPKKEHSVLVSDSECTSEKQPFADLEVNSTAPNKYSEAYKTWLNNERFKEVTERVIQ